MTGREGSRLWVSDGSHKFVTYSERRRLKLAHSLRMQELIIPPYFVFFGRGYLQHGGTAWNGTGNLRYHMYLIPSGHELRDTIAFALGWSMKRADEDSSSESKSNSVNIPPQPNTDDGKVDNDAVLPDEQNDNTSVDDIQQG